MGAFADEILTRIGESGVVKDAAQVIKSVVMSGFEELERSGSTAGSEIRSMLENADREHSVTAAPAISQYQEQIKGHSTGPGWDAIRDHLDLGKTSPTADLQTRAEMIRALKEDMYSKFVKEGLADPKYALKNHFSHVLPDELYGGPKREKMLDHLVQTGQARSRTEAEQIMAKNRSGGQKVPTIELRRTANYPEYRKDSAVEAEKFNEGYRRLAQVKHFGKKDELLMQKFDQVAEQGGDKNRAKHLAEMYLGRKIGMDWTPGYAEAGMKRNAFESAVGSAESATKLSLAVLRHVGQPLNVPIITKMGPTIRSMADMLSRTGFNGGKFTFATNALDMGAILENTLRQIKIDAGVSKSTIGSKVLESTGFYTIDKYRRIFASTAGRFQAEGAFKELLKNSGSGEAQRTLAFLGVNTKTALERKALSLEDLMAAGKRVADVTQFRTSIATVPAWWRDNPYGRMATMYKQFFFQQSKFIKDFVVKPALRKGAERDLRPLITFAILFPTFGEIVADVNELARKGSLKDRPNAEKYPLDRIIDNIANVGGFGIWKDLVQEFATGDKSAVMSFLVGPALSDVADVGTIPFRKSFHDPHWAEGIWKNIEKKGVRAVPVIGSYAYNKIWPKSSHRYDTPMQRGDFTKASEKVIGLFD